MAATFEKIESSTIQIYIDRNWYDQFFKSRALFFKLRDNAKTLTGGTEIRVPLMIGANTTADSYSGYDTIATSAQQPFANAAFNWKQYAVSITISGAEEKKNQGEAQILDLLTGLEQNARESLFNVMNTDAYSDGTGNGGRDLDGLAIQVDSTGTCGGIDRTTYTWWAAQDDAMGGALTVKQLGNTYNDCTQGSNETPDLIVTTQAVFEAYEALLQPDMRYESKAVGEGGFKSLVFKGTPIVWDPAATAQAVWFLNTKYLGMRTMAGRDFKMTEFVRPANQDARVAQVLWMGNLIGSQCRKQGVLTGVTS